MNTSTLERPASGVAEVVDNVTRREFVLGGLALALVGACGADDDAAEPTPAAGTVEHRYGTTTTPTDPRRVVTVGLVDHDAVLAVGVAPIAVTADEYSSGQPHGVWPWAQPHLAGATPEVLPAELNLERIAALEPDLILAVYSGITDQDYERLSQIAPTVAQPRGHEDYQAPWDVMTRLIGTALGQARRADNLVADVERAFADARGAHPEFAGKHAVYAGSLGDGGYYAETSGSARVGILTSLGFAIPDDIHSDSFYMEISRERLDLLDRDLLLWELGDPAARAAIESDPLYQQLGVARERRDVFIVDPILAGGLALISVLGLPFVLDQLVPKLAAAVDGDPATAVPE